MLIASLCLWQITQVRFPKGFPMRDFQLPGRSPVLARHAMCATSHPLAVECAVGVMREGGNAVDAAVTAALTMGLLEPAMTGIGGDAFALVWKEGDARPRGLNGSGRAPMAIDASMLRREGLSAVEQESAHAVTVPGAIDAFDTLLSEFGTYGWDRALAPSIKIAREGHPVAQRAAADWAAYSPRLTGDMARHFLVNGERAPRMGEVFAYPANAEALEIIAREGRAGFYEGPVAADMVATLNKHGGRHTLADFAATKSTWVEPVSGHYRGMELIELPPNGQGVAAILMARILEGFELDELDPHGPERAHIEAEAARLAYDARNRLIADPDTPGADERLAHLMAEETVRRLQEQIDPMAARSDLLESVADLHELGAAIGTGGAQHKDTIYITVVDADRTMVSLIYSVFHDFGSRIASERYGINFQSRGAGFTLEEGHPNELKGGKRPMHTIIPGMMAKDGKPYASFGVMGGAYQSNGHARLISNLVDYGMDPQAAMDAPRSFFDKGYLSVERGYSRSALDRLGVMGHDARIAEGAIGGGQIIIIDPQTGCLIGGSDPRKDGCALGF